MQAWEASTGTFSITTPEKTFELAKELFKFEKTTKNVIKLEEKFCPNVIEPSFGIGRVIYCILEHCFKVRAEDAQRTYFTFPPLIAPVKTSILPLISGNEKLQEVVKSLKKFLNQEGISSKLDDASMSIGRRYARTDECGIPFAVTVDFQSLEDKSVTL
jgi:glycyl-tRNA synthetase